MPKMTLEDMGKPVKLLNLGKSGSGKSGALASLANAGWKLYIQDFDNGIDIIRQYLTEEGATRVWYTTLTDKMKATGMAITPDGVPTAFSRAMSGLQNWQEEEEDLGPINSWGEDVVYVVDSLTFLAAAAMRFSINMQVGGDDGLEAQTRWMHPYPSDYGEAQNRVERFLEMIYTDDIKCNVIMNTHIRWIGGGGVQTSQEKVKGVKTGELSKRELDSESEGEGYPMAVGKQLPRKIGTYFNNMVMCERTGSGLSTESRIHTVNYNRVQLKTQRPKEIPPTLDLDDGLAKIFEIIKGKPGES